MKLAVQYSDWKHLRDTQQSSKDPPENKFIRHAARTRFADQLAGLNELVCGNYQERVWYAVNTEDAEKLQDVASGIAWKK